MVDALVAWTEKEERSPKETYIWYDIITVLVFGILFSFPSITNRLDG